MRNITLEECKTIQLNILKNVADFCENHHINYSLAYGTLIGAIRHNGFIPWDDDIDIMMTRNEYEKFVASYKDDHYVLIPGDNIANHYHVVISDNSTQLSFEKGTANDFFYKGGVWIDIFPLDYVPDNSQRFRKMKRKMWWLAGLEQTGQYKKNYIRTIAHYILRPFASSLGKRAHKLIQAYNKPGTHTLANLSLWYLDYPSFPAYYMKEFIDLSFEGYIFKAIKHYDDFLRGIYGDYMQLPPITERTQRHSYKAYWKEK